MRHFTYKLSCALGMILGGAAAHAGITMAPLSTFGTDGWLAPGTTEPYLDTNNLESGLAYGNGHLYLVSHANIGSPATPANIRILDPNTGADLGALKNTGINTGTIGYAVSSIAVSTDGTIYVSNLSTFTGGSSSRKFNIYKWTSESATPTVAYTGSSGINGEYVGGDLAVIGTGTGTMLAAGYNSSSGTTPDNGYTIITPNTSPATATAVNFSTTPPNPGDFQTNVAFIDSSHVIGTGANSSSSIYNYTSFTGSTGTLSATPAIPDPAGSANDNLLAYAVIDGLPLLAVGNTNDAHVSIYDMTDPTNPVWLASGNNTVSPAANDTTFNPGTGEMAWGTPTTNADGSVSVGLYDLSTNQGIQAFVVTVPEPASLSLAVVSLVALTVRRRKGMCR